MTDRIEAAARTIMARAAAAAGEAPPAPAGGRTTPDRLGALSALLVSPAGAPPCTDPTCGDDAYVRVLTRSGSADDALPYCGRHARRVWLDGTSRILPL